MSVKNATGRLDPVTLGVLGGSLQAIGLEMGHALKRMAYSPAAQQVEDLGGGLFTVDGREICESDTTPMHIGSIPAYIRGFMRRLQGKVNPGDVIIHNHPYHGASHSPDLCVAVPIFWEQELIAWSASTIHLSDTGGVFPGIAIDVHDVWAESKLYDSLKLYERGVRNEQLWQFFVDNTRTPSYVIGDTEAMIAAGRLGERRFLGLLEKYGKDTVLQAIEEFLDYCERMMRAQIESVPDGSWEADGWLDDDGRNRDQPLYVKAKVEISGSDITVDLSESCDNVPTGFNVPFGGSVLPGIYTVIRSIFLDEATFSDFIPQNDGIFRPIKVVAREGSIFNPTFPRSALSRVCPIMRASDCAIVALSEVVPDRVCAGCSAVGVGVYTGYIPEQEEYWVHVEINEGAYGGRCGKDGMDAIDVLTVNSRNTPIEETDWLFPLHTVRYEMRDDVEPAPGKWRGGLGIVRENRFTKGGAFTTETDRAYDPPPGLFGGGSGHTLRLTKIEPDGSESPLYSKNTNYTMEPGAALRWEQACGGGYGDPLERAGEAVLRDWLDELISVDDAREQYGVVIDEPTHTVDASATDALRAQRRARMEV
jgi:N-methylhydantoinase B/oxoprolinase/acetone carboxylase alpha subunit